MYREPFDGDNPISDEEKELDMSGFDPDHDYMKDVDAMQPGWRGLGATGASFMPRGTVPSAAAFSDVGGPHEVVQVAKIPTGDVDKKGRPKVRTARMNHMLPHKPFVRWIDLAGNLAPLIVSSVRPDAENPTGMDGTAIQKINAKQRRGGIVVEGDTYRTPWAPNYVGNQYVYWALEVMKYRKALHASWTKQEQEVWIEDKRKEARAQNAENAAVTGAAIGASMKDALREVVNEVRTKEPRAPKAEKQP